MITLLMDRNDAGEPVKSAMLTGGFSNTENSANSYINNGYILYPDKLKDAKLDVHNNYWSKDQGIQEKSEKKGFSELTNILIGFALGTTGSFLIATGISCTQALEGAVPDFELAAMRGAVQFILASCFLLALRQIPRVDKKAIIFIFIYSSLYTGFNVTNYLSVRYIPVGLSGCVRRAAIIVNVAVLARIFLKERITLLKALGMVLCITGVVLVVQPWVMREDPLEETSKGPAERRPNYNILLEKLQALIFNNAYVTDTNSTPIDNSNSTVMTPIAMGSTYEDEMLGYGLAITSGICLAIAMLLQKVQLQSYNASTLSFYNGLNGAIIPLVISVLTEDLVFPSDVGDIGLVLGQSIASGSAALVLIKTNIILSPVVMSVLSALEVVFLLIAQHTVLQDIQPSIGNWVEYTGAALVVLAAFLPTLLDILHAQCAAHNKQSELKYKLSAYSSENEENP